MAKNNLSKICFMISRFIMTSHIRIITIFLIPIIMLTGSIAVSHFNSTYFNNFLASAAPPQLEKTCDYGPTLGCGDGERGDDAYPCDATAQRCGSNQCTQEQLDYCAYRKDVFETSCITLACLTENPALCVGGILACPAIAMKLENVCKSRCIK
jgi:hypothetical protein